MVSKDEEERKSMLETIYLVKKIKSINKDKIKII
jgi:hypothetical protein